ncbi:MAG: hypothetical protein LKF96_07350 [Treponema sp.]|jgi:hypothetical protein|nr:hypothetical protein [Treponema sp.]
MAKVTAEERELFNKRIVPYKEKIGKSLEKEKNILNLIEKDSSGNAYKKLVLCDEMLYLATLYMVINGLSLKIMKVKNNDSLNDARKTLYKAIIYLEEIVTNSINVPFSDIEGHLTGISNTPLEKRFFMIRKLGLCIDMLIEAFGDNSKWKWSFVELCGRYAVVAKNLLDFKKASQSYFDPRSPDYELSVRYLRLINRLLEDSAAAYRDRYELSTRRLDDMRLAINYLLAQRRLNILIGKNDTAEDIKKKAVIWRDKMEADQKAGTSN